MANRKGFAITWIAALVMASGAATSIAQDGPPQDGPGQGGFGQGGPGGPPPGGPQGGMRMGPPHGPMLLLNPQVIKELKETDDQVAQIKALMPKGGRRGRGGQGGPGQGGPPPGGPGQGDGGQGGPPPGGPGGQGGPGQGGPGGPDHEEVRKMEASIKKILSESQFKRYHQIDLQVSGPQAFLRPEVSEALSLTDDQRDKIEEIMESSRPQGGPGGPGQGGPGRGGDPAEMGEKIMKKVLGVLSDSQKSKWKEMTGAAFKLERPKGGQGGPGGPGGPPPGGPGGGGIR